MQTAIATSSLCRPSAIMFRQLRNSSCRRCSLVVKAEQNIPQLPSPPKGVTQPRVSPEVPPPLFGFVEKAERLNSRAAMIGFFALIALEAILGRGLLEAVGLRVGNGLPFEI